MPGFEFCHKALNMAIDFKGSHYPKSVILYAVFFYVRYAVSYRDLEEIMVERGVDIDHATLNQWVVKFAPLIAGQAQTRKRPVVNHDAWAEPTSKESERIFTVLSIAAGKH